MEPEARVAPEERSEVSVFVVASASSGSWTRAVEGDPSAEEAAWAMKMKQMAEEGRKSD